MGKLRLGILGAGNIAQNAHLPVYAARDDVELVAIADLNLARAQGAAEKFSIGHAYDSVEALLEKEELDAVDICVWNRSHAPCAIAAAKKGVHILCEKPMAWNLSQALEMKKAVEQSGVTFMMALPNRFKPEYQLGRRLLDEGRLGEVYYAKTAMIRRRGTPLGWFTDTEKSGGGPVIDIGIHAIDRAWFLMGCPNPTRVSASTSSRIGDYKTQGVSRWVALDSDVTAFDTEDSAAGVIHFENGASLLFEVSWALNAPPQDYTQVCGTLAGITMDPLTLYGEEAGHLSDAKLTTLPANPFAVEIDHFLHCIRTGEAPSAPIEHGVTMQRMLEGIYQSAALGREVQI